MPQASLEVTENFKGDDCLALAILAKNFRCRAGVFSEKVKDYLMTMEEYWALRYLIEEWDYDYEENTL